ncbi:hypothetical protein [Actinomadura sp. 6N118]|uniref:hypothetical protein n=1 Tax=Actinomadura sp. 6N118 TaxID=3375151 RepID=UPI0037892BDD
MSKDAPRTVLEFLVRESDHTYGELSSQFNSLAKTLGVKATISDRHLRRLASGQNTGEQHPATRRVLQRMFGRQIDELLSPYNEHDSISPVDESDESVGISGRIVTHTVEGALSMAAQRARQFALSTGQVGLTAEALDQIHQDVHELALAYPQRPLSEILGDLVNVQDIMFTLLEQRQRPQQASHLYFLAGVTGGMLAKASHDLAEPHAAMTQARTAFLCADTAGHDGLRAWLRGLQSFITYWAGRPHESVRYAQEGAEFADRAGNSSTVWLAMNEARAWAALRNPANTTAAIRRAEDAWDRVQPDDMDELGGLATFSRARQLYYAADALAWLPDEAAEAERYSSEAVSAYSDPSRPEWAFGDQAGSHTDLAISRIAQGELEGASEALAPVLDLPPELRINGIVNSVDRVHRALTAASESSIGTELQERIELFTHTPLKALPR